MEGNGPIDGTAKDVGLLIVGDDPVAVDATTSHVMGFDPDRFTYLREAGRFLGVSDLTRIEIRGEDPDTVVDPFVPAPTFGGPAVIGGQ
jgi:uncharacterized protein (DUF362 family)